MSRDLGSSGGEGGGGGDHLLCHGWSGWTARLYSPDHLRPGRPQRIRLSSQQAAFSTKMNQTIGTVHLHTELM